MTTEKTYTPYLTIPENKLLDIMQRHKTREEAVDVAVRRAECEGNVFVVLVVGRAKPTTTTVFLETEVF